MEMTFWLTVKYFFPPGMVAAAATAACAFTLP